MGPPQDCDRLHPRQKIPAPPAGGAGRGVSIRSASNVYLCPVDCKSR